MHNVRSRQADGKSFYVFVTLLNHGADPTLTYPRDDKLGKRVPETEKPALAKCHSPWRPPIVALALFHPESCRKAFAYFNTHEQERRPHQAIFEEAKRYIKALDAGNFQEVIAVVEARLEITRAEFRRLNDMPKHLFLNKNDLDNHNEAINNYLGLCGYLETLIADYTNKLKPGRPSSSSDEVVPRSDLGLKNP